MRQPTRDQLAITKSVAEISKLQEEISLRGQQLFRAAQLVTKLVKRAATDDNTAVYLTYAKAMMRYAGAVENASSRNKRTARLLNNLVPVESEEEELAEQESKDKQKRDKQASKPKDISPAEYLLLMYTPKTETE